ncbi:hypothetical protein [Paenibacillus sp. DCT19]|uniref:hypothetical protein n=1 Tax=Paenibacillus sp. DCT19 TaxID=2211212 RepID=UPI000FE1BB6C|nr:hypothetical protein [Paenibacillus sp. DCT19]
MVLSIIAVVIGIIIGWIDLPTLFKNKQWKETAVYSVLLLAGITFSVIAVNLWEFPSPLKLVVWIYEPINQLLARMTGT